MTFNEILSKVNGFAWGPWMLLLLVGTGVYLSIRAGFIQFGKFGYAMKNTIGKAFKKQEVGQGEVSPFQAMCTALAATVGTGNIAGVTGAIVAGGPGAVFWMWISALFGMCTKYSEVVLSIKYRERNEKGDWVGGPMYYIKNGLGKNWKWLGTIFCLFGALAAFGIGNMTQVNTIASSINGAINAFGGDTAANAIEIFGQTVPVSSIIIGAIVAVIVALTLMGGIKRIGSVAELMVPVMAAIYILGSLAVIIFNGKYILQALGMIFQYAFNARAIIGGTFGSAIMLCIQKGVGRGVFSNEAGLGSAPMAHAASSENNPVKQGMFGIFEVFMDTIVICSMTSLVILTSVARGAEAGGIAIEWGTSGGTELIAAAFSGLMGGKAGNLIVAVGISLFALSTILSWSLYGTRCFEYLFGMKATKVYQIVFILVVVVGATLKMQTVWDIADTLNGLMAIPNLIALLGLSGVTIKLTKEFFAKKDTLE